MDCDTLERSLWHGTRSVDLLSIMAKGLQVGHQSRWAESEWKVGVAYIGNDKRLCDQGVYLADCVRTAMAFGQGDEDDEYSYVPKNKVVVIEIIFLPVDVRVGPDGFGQYMTDGDIPSNCFGRVLTYRQALKLLDE